MTDVGDIKQDEWGSHLPAVLACLASTIGPVLEVGNRPLLNCCTPRLLPGR